MTLNDNNFEADLSQVQTETNVNRVNITENTPTIIKMRTIFGVKSTEKFLNKMGKKGLFLVKTYPFTYVFKKTDKVWSYSVEWLNSAPESEENQEYIKQKCENDNLTFCSSKYCFSYFAAEGEIPPAKDMGAIGRMRKRFLSLSLFWTAVLSFFSGLLTYNLAWAMKFKIINYKVYYNKDEILDVFKDLVVGKNPAVLFLYLVIPLTVLVLLIASLYWGEYEYWNKYYKLQKKQIKTLEYKGEDNEKSELQG